MIETTDHSVENEPSWLRKLRRSVFAGVFFAAGMFVAQFTNIAESIGKLYDRYFKEPEAFVLADKSAKSAFSDALAQRAWRRLFWANNFRARVVNAAPLADIDASWKSYIDADAEWNANLMIAIVGLDRHYDSKRSEHLEGTIQDLFSKLDEELFSLRNSSLVNSLRDGRKPNDQERNAAKALSDGAKAAYERVNAELYELVRCISPTHHTSDKKNLCL